MTVLAADPGLSAETLGSAAFRRAHGVRLAYAAGAMANGVASEDLVLALGRAGLLGSFGAAGLGVDRVEAAVRRLGRELPDGPYAFNLIHSPDAPGLEDALVDLYLRLGVRTVEASAFMDLAAPLVRFRVAGLEPGPGGAPVARTRVVAKLSRLELLAKLLAPPPDELLRALVASGAVTEWQARVASTLPVAEDVTIEADSGGHTDRQPLVALLPAAVALRDAVQAQRRYRETPRIGAAGGIGTPAAVAAAFTLGADYVVTGSVNQACVESGTSPAVRELLAEAELTDTAMAPAADMFELGVQVQVLKRGTLFPMRARRLHDLYRRYPSLDALPAADRERLERELFRRPLDEVWDETAAFFRVRDPEVLAQAERDERQRMALVFRWYLGLSSKWATAGDPERAPDFQVWCGPSMGAFNAWAAGTELADPSARRVADLAWALMRGAAELLGGRGAPPASTAAEHTAEALEDFLVAQIAEQLDVAETEIDPRRELAAYAVTSSQALVVLARLEDLLGRRLSPTLVWNYPTIETLAAHLARG